MTRAALLAATLFAVALAAHARVGLDTLFTQTPGEMRFVPDPAHAGYETTVLVGNLTKPGVYAVQTKLPANITIVPHTHGEKWRIANVLSGTLYYAQGDKFDESKLRALPPGSLIVEPENVPHFARTKGEPVLLHIVGEGPASTVPVRK
jgi:quercetin dioxygenase-like cupin family protein